MRRGLRRTSVSTTLLALTLLMHFSLGSSLSQQLRPVRSRPVLRVPWNRAPATPMGYRGPTATAGKRRARPLWWGHSRNRSPPAAGSLHSWSKTGGVRRSGLSGIGASGEDRGSAAPAAAAGSRVSPSMPPPLTHQQLPEESIYLLDGTSMLFRAFYGRGAGGYLAPNGATEVGAVLAMGIEFAQFINEVKPRYIAMAFDVGRETTFRRKLFPKYKAQRKPVPVDLALQVPLAKALSEALGCRTFAVEGYEADDVMATLTRWGRSAGLGVVVCSSDKDMCQLVRDRVHIMQPRSNGYSILGAEEVVAKFGVKPSSLPDLFGLVGDVADNIPGVKGIGQKGGARLLESFGTLEGLFAGVEGVGRMPIRGSKGLQALLSQPGVQDEAMLYREIATLHDEVPLEGLDALSSSTLLYRGARPEAEGVMSALGFHAPLRMIQEGLTTTRPDPAPATWF